MGVKVLDKPTVTIEPELCKGCGLCLDACPPDVLKYHEKFNTKGYHYAYYLGDGCTGCGVCAAHCPSGAITTRFSTDEQLTAMLNAALSSGDEDNDAS